jgi:DNA ligase-1
VLFAEVAEASTQVAATSARSAKVAVLAECLRHAAPEDVPVVVAHLSGELRQRRTGVGWASLRDLPAPAPEPTLTVTEVDAAVDEIAGVAGKGSQTRRSALVSALFARATDVEQAMLRGLFFGEIRQGALEGVMLDAVAKAAELPGPAVRRAAMLRGAVGPVAQAALAHGADGLASFSLEVGRPLQPMLAGTADGIAAALERVSPAAVEWKLDGVRVQVHRDRDRVTVFTRSLDDITHRVPEVVDAALALPVESVVLDGEAIALRPDGRPRPFQETASRIGQRVEVAAARQVLPLSPYFFDVLHVDGDDVLALPGAERYDVLYRVVPETLRAPRLVTDDVAAAGAFLDDALARGHEGVVVKALDVPYEAGRRGSGWLKVKPVHTLDLVVLAVEWGHGRRQGWLSNLHLGALDPVTGGFVMLGKTFKGLTDAMLQWQTERLLELAEQRTDWVVTVRPELVVEVAFDGVQASPRYPAGMALRFARVLRHRTDKRADEADTIDTVRAIHERGAG